MLTHRLVKFTLPKKSETILIMSQSDDRFYKSLASSSIWSFNYMLFKAGVSTPIASSHFSYFLNRSNTLRMELEEGDYVVHVRSIARCRNSGINADGLVMLQGSTRQGY